MRPTDPLITADYCSHSQTHFQSSQASRNTYFPSDTSKSFKSSSKMTITSIAAIDLWLSGCPLTCVSLDRLSLKLEPPESDSKSNSTFYVRQASHPIRPAHDSSLSAQSAHTSAHNHSMSSSASLNRLSASFNFADSMPAYSKKIFTSGHRRAHSLGTNLLSSISMTSIIPMASKSRQTKVQNTKNRCLIDDSVINEEPVVKTYENLIPSLPKLDMYTDDDQESLLLT